MAGREGMGGGSGGEGGRGGGWSEAGRGVGAVRDCPWRGGIVRGGEGLSGMAVWSVMPTSLGGSAGSSRGWVRHPRPCDEPRAPYNGGRRYPNRRLRREGRRSCRGFPVIGSPPVATSPGVDWYRRYGLTCRSGSGSVQERCRLLDGMATHRDARESARQRMSALAGVSQKGCAGKTA